MSLSLNVLPVRLVDREGGTVYVAETNLERDAELRQLAGHRVAFTVYFHGDRTFMWALPGGALPAHGAEWVPAANDGLPTPVIAYAVREAATRKMLGAGFERLPGGFDAPVRFFRRKVNLASSAATLLQGGATGLFPVLSIQQIILGEEEGRAGEVGLIVGVRTIRRLEGSIAELSDGGVVLEGMPLRWDHPAECHCDPALKGPAGSFVEGDPVGGVVLRRGTTTTSAWGPCLAPMATRKVLTDYIARLAAERPDRVQATLDRAIDEQRSLPRLIEALDGVRRILSPLVVIGGATAEVGGYLEVPGGAGSAEWRVWPVVVPSAPSPMLNFQYGDPLLSGVAGSGLRRFGPFDEKTQRRGSLAVTVLAPESLKREASNLHRALTGPVRGFDGMRQRLHLDDLTLQTSLFDGEDHNAYREAAAAIAAGQRPDVVFLIIREEFRYARLGENPYLAAKAVLVGREVANQAITAEKLRQGDDALQWMLDSLVVAAYAKADNTPFVLHDPGGVREITVGVGRTDVEDLVTGERTQLYGSAVVFRQDGDYLYGGSTTPVLDRQHYQAGLARLLREALDTYQREQGSAVERLVVHVFKRTGRCEVAAVTEALAGREPSPEVALVHVNRDSPLQLFCARGSRVVLPSGGTVVALSAHDRLLVTGEESRPGAHPLRLTLDRTSTMVDMDRIVAQTFGLTAMSWRGLRRGHEPVTVAYGRLLARKVAELRPYGLQEAGLSPTPWFL